MVWPYPLTYPRGYKAMVSAQLLGGSSDKMEPESHAVPNSVRSDYVTTSRPSLRQNLRKFLLLRN
jgi:hypothetical protein